MNLPATTLNAKSIKNIETKNLCASGDPNFRSHELSSSSTANLTSYGDSGCFAWKNEVDFDSLSMKQKYKLESVGSISTACSGILPDSTDEPEDSVYWHEEDSAKSLSCKSSFQATSFGALKNPCRFQIGIQAMSEKRKTQSNPEINCRYHQLSNLAQNCFARSLEFSTSSHRKFMNTSFADDEQFIENEVNDEENDQAREHREVSPYVGKDQQEQANFKECQRIKSKSLQGKQLVEMYEFLGNCRKLDTFIEPEPSSSGCLPSIKVPKWHLKLNRSRFSKNNVKDSSSGNMNLITPLKFKNFPTSNHVHSTNHQDKILHSSSHVHSEIHREENIEKKIEEYVMLFRETEAKLESELSSDSMRISMYSNFRYDYLPDSPQSDEETFMYYDSKLLKGSDSYRIKHMSSIGKSDKYLHSVKSELHENAELLLINKLMGVPSINGRSFRQSNAVDDSESREAARMEHLKKIGTVRGYVQA